MPRIVTMELPKETDEHILGVIRIEGDLTPEQQAHVFKLWAKIWRDTNMLVMMEPLRKNKKTGLWKLYFIINNVEQFAHITNAERRDIMSESICRLFGVLRKYLRGLTQQKLAASSDD